ncbi:enoyl-CoA hydratase [Actinomadura sp. NBRC 104425]|uniref:enoyl-CoA hydratase-related protein n=1 Tax=Actinomadura sp. NBRC 104425 TaxID=3032204 RepID=UPI0024A0AD58|nr:enoyl-CoA hydratase-related protein [Actinomadura sp. NBRC 104425]GLZ15775.1 enoyl-CoA hydratase [Actinomadura sp. NBRC 104425]
MELKVTRYDIDGDGIATLWLSRPGRANSWTGRMHDEYRWICARLDEDPAVRVIVLTGEGDVFCGGADYKALDHYTRTDHYDPALSKNADRPGYGVRPEFDSDMAWQLGLRKPMIAAINGSCAGIAVALAAFCDLRFAVEDAKITTVAARIGLPAEYGLSWILPRLMGVTHAADLILTGRVATAAELRHTGLFNKVLPREGFMDAVYDYARLLAAASPAAVTAAKRQIWSDLLRHDPAAAVEESKELIGRHMQTPDYKESVAALLERRAKRSVRAE